jgi:hypothetical protein
MAMKKTMTTRSATSRPIPPLLRRLQAPQRRPAPTSLPPPHKSEYSSPLRGDGGDGGDPDYVDDDTVVQAGVQEHGSDKATVADTPAKSNKKGKQKAGSNLDEIKAVCVSCYYNNAADFVKYLDEPKKYQLASQVALDNVLLPFDRL